MMMSQAREEVNEVSHEEMVNGWNFKEREGNVIDMIVIQEREHMCQL